MDRIKLYLTLEDYLTENNKGYIYTVNGYAAILVNSGQIIDAASTPSSPIYYTTTNQTQEITVGSSAFTATIISGETLPIGYMVPAPYQDSDYATGCRVYTATSSDSEWEYAVQVYVPNQDVYASCLDSYIYINNIFPIDMPQGYFCSYDNTGDYRFYGKEFVLSDTVVEIRRSDYLMSAVTATCVETGEIVFVVCYFYGQDEYYYFYTGETTDEVFYCGDIEHKFIKINYDEVLRRPEPGLCAIKDNKKVMYNLFTKNLVKITAKYNVVSTEAPTPICYTLPLGVQKAVLDGKEVIWNDYADGFAMSDGDGGYKVNIPYGMGSAYTFETTGEHEIVYYFKGDIIPAEAFYSSETLTDIEIGEGIRELDDYSFAYCSNLTGITLPSTLKRSGMDAFSSDEFQYVNFNGTPDEWGQIDWSTYRMSSNPLWQHSEENPGLYFKGQLLEDITITPKYKILGPYAFYDCQSITSVTIEEGVTSIGGSFRLCKNLKSISLPTTLTGSVSFYQCQSLESIIIPSGITSLESESLGYSTYIGAFEGCSALTSVTLPQTLTVIGRDCFLECSSLQEIVLPNSVETIDISAFQNCTSLQSITIPNNVTIINSSSFRNCSSLTSVTLNSNITVLSANCFQYCSSLQEITIPNSVEEIKETAFGGCSGLTSVTLSQALTKLPVTCFSGCSSLNNIVIPSGVTIISQGCFIGCTNLSQISFPDSLEEIVLNAFDGTPFIANCPVSGNVYYVTPIFAFKAASTSSTTYTLTSGTKKINACCFSACTRVTAITIPNTVDSIGKSAFQYCTSLKRSTIPGSVSVVPVDCFRVCTSLTSVTISSGVTYINDAFNNCRALSSITISNSVTGITNGTLECTPFSGYCTVRDNILYPNSVLAYKAKATSAITGNFSVSMGTKYINDRCFYGCSGITSITLPTSLEYLGSYAFYNCTSLTQINFSGSLLKHIGQYAFNGCQSLLNITIPSSVTEIEVALFGRCYSLTSVTLPDYDILPDATFESCVSLSSYTIPNTVKRVGSNCFNNCSGLTELVVGQNVEYFGSNSLGNLKSITSITSLMVNKPTMDPGTFGNNNFPYTTHGIIYHPAECDVSCWLANPDIKKYYPGYKGSNWTDQII